MQVKAVIMAHSKIICILPSSAEYTVAIELNGPSPRLL